MGSDDDVVEPEQRIVRSPARDLGWLLLDRRFTVQPDDIVIGDADGVVVVPRAHAEAVLAAAREIDLREAEQTRLILAAKSLRAGLAKYGRI
jgi:hypothetical protein